MASKKLWGELEEDEPDETILQNVNFNPIIELAMQNIPEIPITVKSSPVNLPKANLITHTIQLHAYSRQLSGIIDRAETAAFEGVRLDSLKIPSRPTTPPNNVDHQLCMPINYLEKEYCDFSLGKGPIVLPFSPESHQRALKQCAAIGLAHTGTTACSSTVINSVADALDIFMNNLCKLMRTVKDREASGLHSGFPDIISKVFTELGIGNLHEFYNNRVVRYHSKIRRKSEQLRAHCEALAVGELPPQLKLEEVPELHFPAALDGAFTPSLEPGFQMLHSLEQDQLQGLELLDASEDSKMDVLEYASDTSSKLTGLSPSAKKKRK